MSIAQAEKYLAIIRRIHLYAVSNFDTEAIEITEAMVSTAEKEVERIRSELSACD